MFINKNKKLKVLTDKIDVLIDDDIKDIDEILKNLDSMIYIDRAISFEVWKILILNGISDIRLTKNMLQKFIEKYSIGVFKMILNNEEAFKKFASLDEYDIEWFVELSEFVVNVEDKNKILKFIDNALKTKGNKFAFFKEMLDALSFIEYMDKKFLDELLIRINKFQDEVEILKLKSVLFRFV